MRTLTFLLFGLLTLAFAATAGAADLPDSAAQMRIVARDGMSFVVEVSNPSDDVARFDGIGLYFVPEREESQRLGVVSAGQVAQPDGTFANAADVINVGAHQSVRVKLTSYCIDAHREGPKTDSQYHLARRRMPSALTAALAGAARTVANLGYYPEGRPLVDPRVNRTADAHAEVQRAVWHIREVMPVALIGDSKHDVKTDPGATTTSTTNAQYQFVD